jgi:AcrR family transcriptional regulator
MATRTPNRPYGGVSAEDRVAARRQKLLDAGLELFGTRGYVATGVKDICREAGVTDRYFYESFKDSELLFLAVFDRLVDDLFVAVAEAVVAAGQEPEPQLRSAIGTFVGALAEDPRKARVIFAEAAAAGPNAAAHMRTTLRRFTDLVAATARRQLDDDVSDEQIRILALSLVGTLERVITERQDGALRIPVQRLVERCVELYAALFSVKRSA